MKNCQGAFMKGFAKKVALVFALCLVCVSFAAAKGAAARKVVGTVSVSKTASADSSTKTSDLYKLRTSSITPAFDIGKVEYVYVKLDFTNGENGNKPEQLSVNDKKLDGDFVYGEWWKIPAEKKNGGIYVDAGLYSVDIK